MKVIGIAPSKFTTEDGKTIEGFNLYCCYPLTADKGTGQAAERIYITLDKLAMCGYSPALGDEIIIGYNRWGKAQTVTKIKAG